MNVEKVFDREAYLRNHQDKFKPLSYRTSLWIPAGTPKPDQGPSDAAGDSDGGDGDNKAAQSDTAAQKKPAPRKLWRRASPMDVQLYDPAQLAKTLSAMSERASGMRDGERKVASLLTTLHNRPPYRRFVLNKDAPARLEGLRNCMDHFGEAIEYFQIMAHVSLNVAKAPIRITPVLLAGPPGVGKSFFASRLAKAIGLPLFRHQMDMASTSGTLAGMDKSWASSSQGLVFNALASGSAINPMIFLDELDKAGGRHQFDPLAPLHCLLEPETAQNFADSFIGFPIDASHIVWIATVNDVEKIDATLISRFRVIDVTQPEQVTMRRLVQEIFHDVIRRYHAQRLINELSRDVEDRLSLLSPREVRITLEVGVGKALLDSRSDLSVLDIQDIKTRRAMRMGFLG